MIREVAAQFEKPVLLFSGGKDSLAMLKLVEEYFDKEGYTDKINVIFRDEEVINTPVREFVLSMVDNPKYNFKYYATQLESEIYILGEKRKYIQWDENREWVVPKPDCAITLSVKVSSSCHNGT